VLLSGAYSIEYHERVFGYSQIRPEEAICSFIHARISPWVTDYPELDLSNI
jgi:hypothetical protein